MSACENHPDREGLLAVSLPSIGIMRHMCPECRSAFDKAMVSNARSAARAGRDPWGRITEYTTGGMAYESDSAWGNSNARYERMRDQHTIDRSKE